MMIEKRRPLLILAVLGMACSSSNGRGDANGDSWVDTSATPAVEAAADMPIAVDGVLGVGISVDTSTVPERRTLPVRVLGSST